MSCIYLLTQVEPFDLFDVSENDWVWRDYLPSSVSNELGEILDKMIIGATKKRFKNAVEILSILQPNIQRQKPRIQKTVLHRMSTRWRFQRLPMVIAH